MAGHLSSSEELWDVAIKSTSRTSLPTARSRIPSIEEVSTKKEPKWTVFSGSQNLTTALNDPASRELDLFTRTWGSYFTPSAPLPPTSLPAIELSDFICYLKETSTGRKLHRAIKREMQKEAERSTPASPATIAPLVALLNEGGKTYDLSTVPRVFMQADFSLEDPPTFQEVFPLSQLMPKIKNHRLDGERKTKEKVGGAKRQSDVMFNVNRSTKLLHEGLTHNLDIIEVHLAHQISQKSDMFFETLTSQQDLQTQIMTVRHGVVETRHKLRQLDKIATHDCLRVCRCSMRLRHHSSVINKLKLISIVQQTQPTIQVLLRTSDFVGALDLIITTQQVLAEDLHGVHALRHLSSQLAELERAIERMMEADFVSYCMEDIKQRLLESDSEKSDVSESEERLVSVVYGLLRQGKYHFLTALRANLLSFLKVQVKDILTSYLHVTPEPGEDPPSLADCIRGMEFSPWLGLLSQLFVSMITQFKAIKNSLEVIAGVCERAGGKNALLPSTVEQGQTPEPEPITEKLHHSSLSPSPPLVSYEENSLAQEAEDRLDQMFLDDELSDARLGLSTDESQVAELDHELSLTALGEPPHKDIMTVAMSATQEMTLDPEEKERLDSSFNLAGIDDQNAIISSTLCHQLLAECHEVMCVSCDLIHARCAKILNIRAKAGLLEDLIPSDFVSLVRLVEKFVNTSTVISGRSCPQLRSSLLSQAKKFLEHFHGNRTRQLSLLLDGERWKQVDVPAEIQDMVSTLEIGIPIPGSFDDRTLTPSSQAHLKPPTNKLVVQGQNFAVVGIVLLLVKIVVEYCLCADDLPMLTTDVLTRLVEILKTFNSRTCELVLGAGAMSSVGLKMITARHLALCTRCLEAVMLLVPKVKLHFQGRLESKQHILLGQFNLIVEDFSSHCRKINVKVMGIMDTMILKQLEKWEAKSPVPSVCFKTLVKQIVRLHDNLVDILPQEQLQALFLGIEKIFQTHLRQQLLKLGITNDGSTQHGIVNSELSHLKGALSSLEGITSFGSSLFDVWTGHR